MMRMAERCWLGLRRGQGSTRWERPHSVCVLHRRPPFLHSHTPLTAAMTPFSFRYSEEIQHLELSCSLINTIVPSRPPLGRLTSEDGAVHDPSGLLVYSCLRLDAISVLFHSLRKHIHISNTARDPPERDTSFFFS